MLRPAPLPRSYFAPAPAPLPSYAPLPAPVPAPVSSWLSFITNLGREPNNPSELQQWTFFNTAKVNKKHITYLEAYIIFMSKSTNKDTTKELTEMNRYGSLLLLDAFLAYPYAQFHWIPKHLRSISNNTDDQPCLFPYPKLNHLHHQQTAQYIAFKNSIRFKTKTKNDDQPKCTAGHSLYHTSPTDLYSKHPAYFNGQFIGFQCDRCKSTFANTFAWHCALCQYDLCNMCYVSVANAVFIKEVGIAPMAPRASQYDKPGSFWPPPSPAPLPRPVHLLGVPPLVPTATHFINHSIIPSVYLTQQQVNAVIHQYEDTFVYNTLSEYINYNQDIYDKLQAFNGKKRYIAQVKLKKNSPTYRLKNVGPFLLRNIDIFTHETHMDKVKMITIDIGKHCPFTVCYKIENDLNDSNALHHTLKKALNGHEMKYDTIDIYERPMTDKSGDILHRKWHVKGIVDPDKHLSTLQHSNDVSTWQHTDNRMNTKFDCISYYHWIPTVFRVNDNITKCELLSEIPNLDPYEHKYHLYPLISDLFLSFTKQFEHITQLNLRGYDLQCIVKVQDYVINDIKEDDADGSYYGNFHKEGLYEDIMAVGLYYYDISRDIKGGELELTAIVSTSLNTFESHPIPISEGTQLVFNNYKCFHRVNKLYGDGNRKIVAFHLINPSNRLMSAKNIVVNWKYHTIHFIKYFCRTLLNNDNIGFMFNIILMYVIGNKQYIETTTEIHNECRRHFFRQKRNPDILVAPPPPMMGMNAPPMPNPFPIPD